MNLSDYILDSPKNISGSHFSDYLYCKRRAWLNIHTKNEFKAHDPRYLIDLQKEGRRFEKEIYSDPIYNNALIVKDYREKEKRIKETINAIKSGSDYIMQAYFRKDEFVGIADILEKVSDIKTPLGHYYKVGDIKSSKEVTSPYILQIMFYNDMLSEIQGYSANEGFIILGNRNRIDIDFTDYIDLYSSCKENLLIMRSEDHSGIDDKYPPLLKSICSNCAFRYFCMEKLIKDKDISLLPQLTPSRIAHLRLSGINNTESLSIAISKEYNEFEFSLDEVNEILKTIENVNAGKPSFREYLSKEKLSSLIPVTLELKDKTSTSGYREKEVQRLFYRLNGKTKVIEVGDLEKIPYPEEWKNHEIILYGLDYIFFNSQVRRRLIHKHINSYDLLKILETYIHYPFFGLELAVVNAQIANGPNTDISILSKIMIKPEERLNAILNIIEWIIKGLPEDD